jgi:hypothetical protein
MNIVKRFRNEIIIFVAFLFMLFSIFYKFSASSFVAEKKNTIEKSIVNIGKISSLKQMWGSKKMAKEAKRLKTIVSAPKVKLYKNISQKIKVKYIQLNTRELNLITKKIINTPFQISKFIVIQNEKESYSLELICRW